MSDEFGTVSGKRGDRAREIEVLRQHYKVHRDTLTQMIPDAPTEQLGAEYQRLVASIDSSVRKLDELEGRGATATAAAGFAETQRMGTAPGNRPLVSSEPVTDHGIANYDVPTDRPANNSSRVFLMLIIGVVVIGVIGYLIWRASSDRKAAAAATQVVERPATTTNTDTASSLAPVPAVPEPAVSSIKIAPAVADYGIIRKGTRAVRQFEITNTTSTPLSITVARSVCRCLYYEYDTKRKLPAKGKEALTVTVDGARAKAGALSESIAVTSKDDPNATGTIGVRAVVK
jgi:hypothetical protein